MKILSSQDQWLIKRWAKARQLEESMNVARQHYGDLFGDVHKQVKKRYPALDRCDSHMKPSEIELYGGGQVIFSKSSWPSVTTTWRTGICIWGISLDDLTAEAPPSLTASIYLAVSTDSDKRIDTLRHRLALKAPSILGNRRIQWQSDDEDDTKVCLLYQLPEGQSGLLAMLSKGDPASFVHCIAKHVELLARFIPVMDGVLLNRKSS
jgi:hypothetical protein